MFILAKLRLNKRSQGRKMRLTWPVVDKVSILYVSPKLLLYGDYSSSRGPYGSMVNKVVII